MQLWRTMRRRPQWVELHVEMAIVADCLCQRRRTYHRCDIENWSRWRGSCHGSRRRHGARPGCSQCRYVRWIDAVKDRTRFSINRSRILQVPIVKVEDIAGVRSVERAQITHVLVHSFRPGWTPRALAKADSMEKRPKLIAHHYGTGCPRWAAISASFRPTLQHDLPRLRARPRCLHKVNVNVVKQFQEIIHE